VVKQINSNRQKEFLVVGSLYFLFENFGGFDQSGKVWNNVKK
tara:strand:- start:94 stop:219 length:126 start_codon:yes stop_codon:yes gene_type:complete